MKHALVLLAALFGLPSFAQVAPGVWAGDSNKEMALVSVTNESNSVLTKLCTFKDGVCYWGISSLGTPCDENHAYPALVSSRAGAVAVTATCVGSTKKGEHYTFVLSEPDNLDKSVMMGGVWAIALPTEGGFSVLKFNADGAKTSLNALIEQASKSMPKKNPNTSLGDSSL